jgi:hypothetical protein
MLWHASLVLAHKRKRPAAFLRFLSAFKFAAGCLLPWLLVAMHQSVLAADSVRLSQFLVETDMVASQDMHCFAVVETCLYVRVTPSSASQSEFSSRVLLIQLLASSAWNVLVLLGCFNRLA